MPLSSYLSTFLILILYIHTANADININTQQKADQLITQLYHNLSTKPTSNQAKQIIERLDYFSQYWLNQPYELWALGDGSSSQYDQKPLYRVDAFDCETYVDTVLALAISSDLNTFKHNINQIRYQHGHVSFTSRNHFTSIDWNKNNQDTHIITDITLSITNKHHHPVALYANTWIDKANWYHHLPISRIRLRDTSAAIKADRLASLHQAGQHYALQRSKLAYIPLTILFNQNDEPNLYLFNQIPNGAIIEIVRPNWDLTKLIGTHLDVSHLGFVFRKQGVLFFRQASSTEKRIVDTPLMDYLRQAKHDSTTIGGINIEILN